MIASWAYQQQSSTCTKDTHIGKLFKVQNLLSVSPLGSYINNRVQKLFPTQVSIGT
jgi:hypothetical protein